MANKYHSSPKIKDIKHSILLAMREERKLRKNYTDEDVVFDGQTVKAQDYEVLEYVGGGK